MNIESEAKFQRRWLRRDACIITLVASYADRPLDFDYRHTRITPCKSQAECDLLRDQEVKTWKQRLADENALKK